MRTSREGFDLFNKYCRMNFFRRFKTYGIIRGIRAMPWSLVIQDTINRVCSKEGK